MTDSTPGFKASGTKVADASFDVDAFALDDAAVDAAAARNDAFVNGQPEVEPSNECDSGACSI